MEHLNRNNLFSECQHGFRSGKSCTTQLLEVLEDWSEALEKGETIDVIYLDFSKAFDKVSHTRLIHKLEKYGVRGNLLNWIEDFLSNLQRVILN